VQLDDIIVLLMAITASSSTAIRHRQSEVRRRQAGRAQGFPARRHARPQGHGARPATAVDSVIKRNDAAKKETELERLRMALHDNIVTPEVKRTLWRVDPARLDKAIDQIALTHSSRRSRRQRRLRRVLPAAAAERRAKLKRAASRLAAPLFATRHSLIALDQTKHPPRRRLDGCSTRSQSASEVFTSG